jgi:uncharacterized protein
MRSLRAAAPALVLTLAVLGAPALAVEAPIYTLQGAGATSPFVGQSATTTGVVTRLTNNGFFMQDLVGDADPATSDGIFVFTSSAPPAQAAIGNLVRVVGTLIEFNPGAASNANTASQPLTQIASVTSVTLLSSGQTIAPVTVSLPLAAGDSFERFEGMLVTLTGDLTVQQNFFQARFGQLTIGAGGRHETPTNRHRPGSAQALALADLQARSRLLLDDARSSQNPNPTPYFFANGRPRAGDSVAGITGVIDFGLATSSNTGFGLYRIHPSSLTAPIFTASNPRPAQPPSVGGNVKVAAMNVLNYFTTFTNGQTADGATGQGCTLDGAVAAGNCRGATNLDEFQRQQTKIVNALAAIDADVVGLMEIQNNGGVAVGNLAAALNARMGAGTYAAVADPAGGMGTDAIKIALIYKPARVTLSGPAASDLDVVNSRPTLAQTFAMANGERFTMFVNHFKSKGSCPALTDPEYAGNFDAGDGQGCWNAKRLQQAQRLRTFVAQQQALGASVDVLLVGDLNSYGQEDPIHNLTSSGYVDEGLRFGIAPVYSYVFDGTAGRLDYAIASSTLSRLECRGPRTGESTPMNRSRTTTTRSSRRLAPAAAPRARQTPSTAVPRTARRTMIRCSWACTCIGPSSAPPAVMC